MKRNYFNNVEFQKYLFYAVGEMVLVIIGILIALQIDNWNTKRTQEGALKSHLKTIARNIGKDLDAMSAIRSAREDAYESSIRLLNFESRKETVNASELAFFSKALAEALQPHTFDANTSGYEALKISGNLGQMQGRNIETLLYDYYDTVVRITHEEQNHNEYSRLLWLRILAEWPDGLQRWELATPWALTADRLQSIQAAYQQLLQSNSTQELLTSTVSVGPLLLDYERLDALGRAFRSLVENDIMSFDDTTVAILDSIYEPGSGDGYPNVIVDGQASWQNYYLLSSDANNPRVSYSASGSGGPSPFHFESFRRTGDSLHIGYLGGVEWAGIWFGAGASMTDSRSLDYSMFNKLVLDMKGDAGGELVHLNLEDRDDPPDGTSTKVTLQLTDQWQSFEIDLAEFETADLRILSVPLGFVFFEEPVAFSVRTAKFVKAD